MRLWVMAVLAAAGIAGSTLAAEPPQSFGPLDLNGHVGVADFEHGLAIDITPGMIFVFTEEDGSRGVRNPGPHLEGDTLVWAAVYPSGKRLRIVYTLEACTQRGRSYPVTAVVTYGDRTYQGCGGK